MENTKINSGILALVLVASFFAGWQATLLVAAVVIIFGHAEDSLKRVLITVLTFMVGIALFQLFWSLIVNGFDLVHSLITKFIGVLNCYVKEPIVFIKPEAYFFTPVSNILSMGTDVIQYAIDFLKFLFILSIIAHKTISKNPLFDKLYTYVDKCVGFVNNFGADASQPAPAPQPSELLINPANNVSQNNQ